MNLVSKLTQQQSTGRAVVSEATIYEFKIDVVDPLLAEPESASLTLNDVGNGDEWWFDLNKLLQSKTVGLFGQEHRQEVPTERSAHVTVFSGACGYETSKAARATSRLRSPSDPTIAAHAAGPGAHGGLENAPTEGLCALAGTQLHLTNTRPNTLDEATIYDNDADLVSDEEFAWLSQLSLDSWDSDDFFLYPVLVLVAKAAGPNDNWTKHCKSEKMLVGTTSDGWMDEGMKLAWYNKAKTYK